MKIGEVCLLTEDVERLCTFYCAVFGFSRQGDDIHSTLLGEETQLTVWNDGERHSGAERAIELAFTVADVDAAFACVQALGARIAQEPMRQPWGARNCAFFDPDGNRVWLRCFPET